MASILSGGGRIEVAAALPASALPSAARAWWMMGLLGLIYILSLVDRLILALLVVPLQTELGLTDVQIGLLVGTAFAIVYSVLGLPLARLADRGNRHLMIICGVLLWSASTICTAFANSFGTLVVLRLGLAIGEAALLPATFSMINDLFPREKRTLAASIFSAMGSAGAGVTFLIGGAIIAGMSAVRASGILPMDLSEWRLVMIVVGLPGVILSLVMMLTTREPARRSAGEGQMATPDLAAVIAHLRNNGRMYLGLFSCGLSGTVSYVLVTWLPTLMQRRFGWEAADTGMAIGTILIVSCMVGTIAGARAGEWLIRRGRPDGFLIVIMVTFAAGIVTAIVTALQDEATGVLGWYLLASTFLACCSNSTIASFQLLAPARMRGTIVAGYMMSIGIAGLGVGPPLAAWLATTFFPGPAGLASAIVVLAVAVGIPVLAVQLWSRPGVVRRMAEADD